jgi:hypothetical protein
MGRPGWGAHEVHGHPSSASHVARWANGRALPPAARTFTGVHGVAPRWHASLLMGACRGPLNLGGRARAACISAGPYTARLREC